METTELLELIAKGEDSGLEFKADITNEKSLAQELVAFANSGGGVLLIGVDDDGSITGLDGNDVRRINKRLSNASSGNVRPSINTQTENVVLEDGIVVVVYVPRGVSKPYMDNDGVVWVRSGADKRKATSREELQRLFQSSGLVHGDEIEVPGMTVADLDQGYFREFYEKEYEQSLESMNIPLPQLLENMNLMKNGNLNRSGALLFAKNPNLKLPVFMIKAVAYPGTDISVEHFCFFPGYLTGIFFKYMAGLKGINPTKRILLLTLLSGGKGKSLPQWSKSSNSTLKKASIPNTHHDHSIFGRIPQDLSREFYALISKFSASLPLLFVKNSLALLVRAVC